MSKTRLIFATGNQGKVNEFKQMLGDEYEILSMKDIGVDIDIEENGTSDGSDRGNGPGRRFRF